MSSNPTPNGVEIIPINEHILITVVGLKENAGENFVDFYENVEAARKMWASDTKRGDYRLQLATLKGLEETEPTTNHIITNLFRMAVARPQRLLCSG
ncbi:hypothetical protein [Okeania sp. SIO2B3]|uniref:hypothetical protein n=1 Tax=Okeania sp. SIO2B3 TaxID=2607784 RepID=UPI0013C00B67|nr:hypothetical protein [Okeania sp. SIO2B3]NET46952.1 hypothetical protein [Okeania sp. SIO2B3]